MAGAQDVAGGATVSIGEVDIQKSGDNSRFTFYPVSVNLTKVSFPCYSEFTGRYSLKLPGPKLKAVMGTWQLFVNNQQSTQEFEVTMMTFSREQASKHNVLGGRKQDCQDTVNFRLMGFHLEPFMLPFHVFWFLAMGRAFCRQKP